MITTITLVIILSSASYLFSATSERNTTLEIISYLVRDRVIPIKTIEMRSTIIVGFKILSEINNLSSLKIKGELYCNDQLISTDEISKLDSSGNNLGFDLPLSKDDLYHDRLLSITEGNYLIVINLYDDHLRLLAQCKKELKREQIGRRFYGFDKHYKLPQYREVTKDIASRPGVNQKKNLDSTIDKDYLIFRKNYLERVYPSDKLDFSKCISKIDIAISRNEYKPLTFSIHALKNLGEVKVGITPLRNPQEVLDNYKCTIGTVNQLTEALEERSNKDVVFYRWAPKIIEPKKVAITKDYSQRYWLTLKVGTHAKPGIYNGIISIKPQHGNETDIPIQVKVLPLRLSDTDINYGMMMSYEFFELNNKRWTKLEKQTLKQNGVEIYRDLREHGMTMVYPHSNFYLNRRDDGEPVLDSLKASLENYASLGFPGPFCWYLGHLLQTAKPSHPGSICNYDTQVAAARLRQLLPAYENIAKEFKIPKKKLVVQLVDEPDLRERVNAGKELNKIARRMGFKILITRRWPEVDIICSDIPKDDLQAEKLRLKFKDYWIYPNYALTTKNRAYTRYVFGFGAWRWGIKGVVPWTFQMTQGCNGNPFTILDGSEVMVAYPGINGLVTTPTWEVIREGINDYKYIYQLKTLLAAEKAKGNPKAAIINRHFEQMRRNLGTGPSKVENSFGDWCPGSFEKRRQQIVKWIFELSAQN